MENSIGVVTTLVELIALAAAVGAAAGMMWILPATTTDEASKLLAGLRRRLWKLLGIGLLIFTPLSLLELLVRTASMSELPLREAAAQIGTVLFKTHYGTVWWIRMAALLIAWAAWGLQRHRLDSRAITALAFAALALISFTFSAAGHAGDDGLFTLVSAANTLHIIGAFLWGGGIAVMAVIVLPGLLRRASSAARGLIATASLRLSTLAGLALAMVVIPGLYNAWLQIGGVQGLITTPYGQVLLGKLALVGMMMLLGALNRYRYVPALQEYGGLPRPPTLFPLPAFVRISGDRSVVLHFLRSLRIELALAVAVLALAAVLSQLTPAIHAQHQDMAAHLTNGIAAN